MGKVSDQDLRRMEEGLEEFLEREIEGRSVEVPPFFDNQKRDEREIMNRERESTKRESAKGQSTRRQSGARRTEGTAQRTASGASGGGTGRKKDTGRKNDTGRKPAKTARRKKKKHGFLKVLLILVIVVAAVAAGAWYVTVKNVYEQVHYESVESLESMPLEEEGVTNILLIGNDSRNEGEDGRSDAMILVSISDKTKAIYMTSLLRDIYVEIPGHKNNRLNAAYSYGGAELLIQTLEANFDIHVSRYVLVNFQAFARLVDAVGGVTLELTNDEVKYVNAYLWEYNMLEERPEGTDYLDESLSGTLHLNGPQALAYCRNRYIGTDFARTERQRKVLSAIIEQAPSALLTNAGEMMDSLLSNLTTNLTQSECLSLSLQAPKVVTYDIIQSSIPLPGTYSNATINKMAVLEVDFEANKKYIRETIYGEEADSDQ